MNYLVFVMYDLLFAKCFVFIVFFKQKTAYEMRISDWSSDVCSSDLRYVDEFVRWACAQLGKDDRYTALSGAGGLMITAGDDPERVVADSAWRRHQMPAYHLVAPDRSGISLVNIGVGPSNAKTITDHLAGVRPAARSEEATSEIPSQIPISYSS